MVTSTANDSERLIPFAPIANILGRSIGTANLVDSRIPILHELRSQLEGRTTQRPLLLALDDLQWADPVTLWAVQRLVSQLSSYPLLWLLAGRRSSPRSPLDDLFGHLGVLPGTVWTRVPPLDPGAVRQVVGDMVGADPDAALLALTDGASGSPLLVVELVEGLRDDGVIELVGDSARLASVPDPEWLDSMVAHRLNRLSAETLRLLEVGAVEGRPFSLGDAAAVLEEPAGELLSPLHEAREKGLLLGPPNAISFRHNVIREVVYGGIPEHARTALHRRIGDLMTDRSGSSLPAAFHLVRSARPGDRGAIAALDKAAREVLPLSAELATEIALRAMVLTEPSDEGRFARMVMTVEALMTAGRLSEASDLARSALALEGWPAVAIAHLRLILSSVLVMTADPVDAQGQAEAVLAAADLPDKIHAGAQEARVVACIVQKDFARARGPAQEILGGGRLSTNSALAAALVALAFLAWEEGHAGDALGLYRAAVKRASLDPPSVRRMDPRLGLSAILTALGEFAEAETVIRETCEEIEQLGNSMLAPAPLISRARLHLAAGQLDDAFADARVGLDMAERIGARIFLPVGEWVLASIALARGELRDAAAHASRCGAQQSSNGGTIAAAAQAWTKARIIDALGGSGRAMDLVGAFYDDLARHKLLLILDPAAGAGMVRLALSLEDRRRAKAVVVQAELLSADNPGLRSVAASASHARGLLNRDPALLAQAAIDHRHPWAAASATEDLGTMVADRGDREAALVQFQRSLATYEEAGADRDAKRVRARLDRLGSDRPRRGRARRPQAGWLSLTDTEREVERLVTNGLTNAQAATRMSLSRHTVDFHLRQIFRKLGISSRVELARIAHQRSDDVDRG